MTQAFPLALFAAFSLGACSQRHDDPMLAESNPSGASTRAAPQGPVHAITLPHDEPELPPGRGREAFVAGCILCHSPRYVTNQPAFTREVWTEEVKKMTAVFGAPVPPEQAAEVVDYLVAFHGTEEAR